MMLSIECLVGRVCVEGVCVWRVGGGGNSGLKAA